MNPTMAQLAELTGDLRILLAQLENELSFRLAGEEPDLDLRDLSDMMAKPYRLADEWWDKWDRDQSTE